MKFILHLLQLFLIFFVLIFGIKSKNKSNVLIKLVGPTSKSDIFQPRSKSLIKSSHTTYANLLKTKDLSNNEKALLNSIFVQSDKLNKELLCKDPSQFFNYNLIKKNCLFKLNNDQFLSNVNSYTKVLCTTYKLQLDESNDANKTINKKINNSHNINLQLIKEKEEQEWKKDIRFGIESELNLFIVAIYNTKTNAYEKPNNEDLDEFCKSYRHLLKDKTYELYSCIKPTSKLLFGFPQSKNYILGYDITNSSERNNINYEFRTIGALKSEEIKIAVLDFAKWLIPIYHSFNKANIEKLRNTGRFEQDDINIIYDNSFKAIFAITKLSTPKISITNQVTLSGSFNNLDKVVLQLIKNYPKFIQYNIAINILYLDHLIISNDAKGEKITLSWHNSSYFLLYEAYTESIKDLSAQQRLLIYIILSFFKDPEQYNDKSSFWISKTIFKYRSKNNFLKSLVKLLPKIPEVKWVTPQMLKHPIFNTIKNLKLNLPYKINKKVFSVEQYLDLLTDPSYSNCENYIIDCYIIKNSTDHTYLIPSSMFNFKDNNMIYELRGIIPTTILHQVDCKKTDEILEKTYIEGYNTLLKIFE